jgi:hypothetical protein
MKILLQYLDKNIKPIPRIKTIYVTLHDNEEIKKFWKLIKKYSNIIISIQVLEERNE